MLYPRPSLRTLITMEFRSLVCPAEVSLTGQGVSRRLNYRKSRRHRLRSIGGTSASAPRRPCQKTKHRDIIGEDSAVVSKAILHWVDGTSQPLLNFHDLAPSSLPENPH